MAENKKSFILYSEWKELFESLDDCHCSELIRHIFRYVNDEDPELINPVLKPVWLVLQPVLKRDLKKWEGQKEQRSLAGKKSAESRQRPSTTVNERQRPSTVNVNVNVNENVINKGFIDLNEQELSQAFEFMFHLGRKEISRDDIKNFWIAFKTHKPESVSESRGKQMQHFRDWLKFQKKAEGKKLEQPATVYNIDEQIQKYL